ncbi:MAG: exodeoxyribonuclease VII small subunit [Alphaproteobacteria bacterium]|nr:exodeoxyribonuclease VII small subunit [Alphaproteobacteria bacterium]
MAAKPGKTVAEETAALSFEEALRQLEEIVAGLEKGQGTLAESIAAYQRGTALRRHCEAQLREAQLKVEEIEKTAEGGVTARPSDLG